MTLGLVKGVSSEGVLDPGVRKMPPKHSEPTKQKALSKFCQGATLGQVAAELDVPRDTVRNWRRKWQKEGIVPKGQPVGHISPEEFRLWVNDNLDDLAHLIRNLNRKIPGPRPARTPVDVWGPLTSGIWNDRLPHSREATALLHPAQSYMDEYLNKSANSVEPPSAAERTL